MSNRYENNSSSGCSYVNVSHYNSGSKGMHPPVRKGNEGGSYVVPVFESPNYNTLVHNRNEKSCCGSPYTDIRSAYKMDDGNCNQKYTTMQCNR